MLGAQEARVLTEFCRQYNLPFKDLTLLKLALTHRSYLSVTGQGPRESNERLEFLGDSVLGLVTSEYLYRRHPDEHEGQLTKTKSLLVSKAILSRRALRIGLGRFVLMSHSEVESGGRQRLSILADAFESVIGAVYLDQGFEPARAFIHRHLLAESDAITSDKRHTNYKSHLQEYVQNSFRTHPVYRIRSEYGPDHSKHFMVEVMVGKRTLGEGRGHNKKEAEQAAARDALEKVERLRHKVREDEDREAERPSESWSRSGGRESAGAREGEGDRDSGRARESGRGSREASGGSERERDAAERGEPHREHGRGMPQRAGSDESVGSRATRMSRAEEAPPPLREPEPVAGDDEAEDADAGSDDRPAGRRRRRGRGGRSRSAAAAGPHARGGSRSEPGREVEPMSGSRGPLEDSPADADNWTEPADLSLERDEAPSGGTVESSDSRPAAFAADEDVTESEKRWDVSPASGIAVRPADAGTPAREPARTFGRGRRREPAAGIPGSPGGEPARRTPIGPTGEPLAEERRVDVFTSAPPSVSDVTPPVVDIASTEQGLEAESEPDRDARIEEMERALESFGRRRNLDYGRRGRRR
jgi:ribonuclease-3